MGKLKVYLSHSARDNAFSQRLAAALRGAGANVWFDVHVRDSAVPAHATLSEMREQQVFIVVLSRAALASAWTRREFERFCTFLYQPSLENVARWRERLRTIDDRLAVLYHEGRALFHHHILAVVVEPLAETDFTGDWQPLLTCEHIATPDYHPYPADEAIMRTVRAVAALLPVVGLRAALADLLVSDHARLPIPIRPKHSVEDYLAHWPVPLEVGVDLDTLIARGQAAAADASSGEVDQEGVNSDAVWCVVANVAEEQPFGPGGHELRRGTKHFAPGAKVYCLPAQWGDGYEKIVVVGRHRATHCYVRIVLPAKRLTNWRTDLVYSPHVIAELAGEWDGTGASKRLVESIVQLGKQREATRQPAAR